jgi:hypothetical protein
MPVQVERLIVLKHLPGEEPPATTRRTGALTNRPARRQIDSRDKPAEAAEAGHVVLLSLGPD